MTCNENDEQNGIPLSMHETRLPPSLAALIVVICLIVRHMICLLWFIYFFTLSFSLYYLQKSCSWSCEFAKVARKNRAERKIEELMSLGLKKQNSSQVGFKFTLLGICILLHIFRVWICNFYWTYSIKEELFAWKIQYEICTFIRSL